ncbi:hypothetical protein AGABI2DRAFT_189141 [Agaricus bisporus var. bisporus H97]|uniref:hypothetical protein n=1 Tax=Agaricus bisporus var. bisporus (strain H97 / ATCC MYA-4626 / FGSC 10389) TaxID=936046 RepID=UPI00029F5540|nr:hypothetical protein AGABI2DRAFT_189141 [Agaricus bisporus var. bisporus H97]EKV50781.1 hypothetical protein AGABI2DRAFT_189141 [Agaricus bisporus var. bisporus H97]
MSPAADDFEGQDALFEKHKEEPVPPELTRATQRLEFPPSYVVVGAYRLLTDEILLKPTWDKCRHAARRGAIVGGIWALLAFGIQRKFIEMFLRNSPKITGLSTNTMFGFQIPFNVHTYAAVLLIGGQVTTIMRFFLRRNMAIARDRAWTYTVESRGKGPDFWQPYIEEWDQPPPITPEMSTFDKVISTWLGRFVLKRILLLPFDFYPFIGIIVSAWLKALGTSRHLHRRYFEAKKMTDHQVTTFIEEHKWDYRAFGFTAALLEGLPIIGLVFMISNRVGAAMWAHDLEKHQHYVVNDRRNKKI